ncbi:uncharacterized protein A4U43_UnF9810 [Asparagus officinalis]|uniref:RNA helicase n=1 Tax=Asparagus officinalis TaxID=4686 RepID=A0A1R3L5M0_ASPOF|nr:uncharacterized protein A4U43_UnF9810 [Asparagus officinalis]
MATAEVAPSYAPEDPSLPKPWTGLIDNSTGALYYWNPETNVTQYEKPVALPPTSASGPLSASTPKLAPIPTARSQAPNDTASQNELGWQMPQQQHMHQQPSQQQHMHQLPSQQQHMHQQPSQHTHHMLNQPPSQPMHHMPDQPTQHYPHLQGNHMGHTQFPKINEHSVPHYQPQGLPTGNHQVQQNGFPIERDVRRQVPEPVGFTAPPIQQSNGASGDRQFPGPAPHIPGAADYSIGPGQYIGRPSSTGTGGAYSELQQVRTDATYGQQPLGGPTVSKQNGNAMNQPLMGPKLGYNDEHSGRGNNDFYPSSGNEGPVMLPHQQQHGGFPHAGNQQGIRMGAAGRDHAGFALAHMGPSQKMFGSADFTNAPSADSYCQHHEITVTGDNIPAPFMTFEATAFAPELLREIRAAGFSAPTPIQAQTWPIALQSRDIVAIAKTGSGKTLGYLLPAFVHLKQCRNNPQIGPTVLVLSPTRELATQIQDEAIKFGRSSRISCTCLYGGAPKGPQLREIERGVDIVVATPGRLNDILEMKKINFSQVSFLVLDEADRMLDMGFEPQIRSIVREIPPRRQTLMYTATWPKEVRKIAGDLLVNPVQVNIGNEELSANKAITQHVEIVLPMEKQRRLEQILRTQERGSKIIIFCSTKRLCDQLARSMRGYGAAAIHGDKSQGERDYVLNQFRCGKAPILVATDVAARGLDIKDIRVVINYDFPTGIEDYVHRIGRTGRAGATGIAYTFISDQDWKHAAELIKILEGANQRVPPQVRVHASSRSSYPLPAAAGGFKPLAFGGQNDFGGCGALRRTLVGVESIKGLVGGLVDAVEVTLEVCGRGNRRPWV